MDVLLTSDGRFGAGGCGVDYDLRTHAIDVESYHHRSNEAAENTGHAKPGFCGRELYAQHVGQDPTPSASQKTHTRGEGDVHGLRTLRSESRAESRAFDGGLPLCQSQGFLEGGLGE